MTNFVDSENKNYKISFTVYAALFGFWVGWTIGWTSGLFLIFHDSYSAYFVNYLIAFLMLGWTGALLVVGIINHRTKMRDAKLIDLQNELIQQYREMVDKIIDPKIGA